MVRARARGVTWVSTTVVYVWPNLGGKWVVFQALGREVEHPYMGVYLAVCHLYGYQLYLGINQVAHPLSPGPASCFVFLTFIYLRVIRDTELATQQCLFFKYCTIMGLIFFETCTIMGMF